jgi:hypothetical protein
MSSGVSSAGAAIAGRRRFERHAFLSSTVRPAVAAVLVVTVLLGLSAAGAWRTPGIAQDEGMLLEYPTLILHGKLPWRDFQTMYGPGTYLPLAAAYAVTGPSVGIERGVGVVYRAGVVFAVMALGSPAGVATMTVSGILAVAGVSLAAPAAYAWYGALACVLWAIWVARRALSDRARRRRTCLAAAGVLLGLAVSIRAELGCAGLIAFAVLLYPAPRRTRRWIAVGVLVGSLPLLFTVAAAGVGTFWNDWAVARFHAQQQTRAPFSPFAIVLVAALAAAAIALLRSGISQARAGTGVTRTAQLAIAALCACILPQALQRADLAHFALVAPAIIGMVPTACVIARPRVARASVVVAVSLILLASYGESLVTSVEVRNEGRSFPVGVESRALPAVLQFVDTKVAPGSRLFVGPRDLRLTWFADTSTYFLLPRLKPAGFYLELTPGDADRSGSPLAAEVARADVLILRSVTWGAFHASYPYARVGSDVPNDVVHNEFREAFRAGPFTVWVRREPASA